MKDIFQGKLSHIMSKIASQNDIGIEVGELLGGQAKVTLNWGTLPPYNNRYKNKRDIGFLGDIEDAITVVWLVVGCVVIILATAYFIWWTYCLLQD